MSDNNLFKMSMFASNLSVVASTVDEVSMRTHNALEQANTSLKQSEKATDVAQKATEKASDAIEKSNNALTESKKATESANNSMSSVMQAMATLTQMTERMDSLEEKLTADNAKHSTLVAEHSTLVAEHSDLVNKHAKLANSHVGLVDYVNKLKSGVDNQIQAKIIEMMPPTGKPTNGVNISDIRKLLNKRHGLPPSVVDQVMRNLDYSPKSSGIYISNNKHQSGNNIEYWNRAIVTETFKRFIRECKKESSKATHPMIEKPFKLIP